MKKMKIGLLLLLATALSVSLFALRDRRYLTPTQEVTLYSLMNRYIEAFCNEPRAIAELLDVSIVPRSLIYKTEAVWRDMLHVQGECFGFNKEEIQEHTFQGMLEWPAFLIKMNMATEYSVKDFFDCLVEVDSSFYDLRDTTARVLDCVDMHLDIRGFWHELLEEVRKPIVQPPNDKPIIVEPGYPIAEPDYCFDSCYVNCTMLTPPSTPIPDPVR